MSKKIYKLQHYIGNGLGEDVTLGQEVEPTANVGLETYLTLSAGKELFLTKDLISDSRGAYSLASCSGVAFGRESLAGGNNCAVTNDNSIVVGSGNLLSVNLTYAGEVTYDCVSTGYWLGESASVDYSSYLAGSIIKAVRKIDSDTEPNELYFIISQATQNNTHTGYNISFNTNGNIHDDGNTFKPEAANKWQNFNFYGLRHSASGVNNLIAGYNNLSIHDYTSLLGTHLQSGVSRQTVVGSFNKPNDAIFSVGSGTSFASRKNILDIFRDKIVFNTDTGTFNQKIITAPNNSGMLGVISSKTDSGDIDAYLGQPGNEPDYVSSVRFISAAPGGYYITFKGDKISGYDVWTDNGAYDNFSAVVNCFPVNCSPNDYGKPGNIKQTVSTIAKGSSKLTLTLSIKGSMENGFEIEPSMIRDGNTGDRTQYNARHKFTFSYYGIPISAIK